MSNRLSQISTAPIALLERMLAKLDLNATQLADLETSYGAVTNVLKESTALSGILTRLVLTTQGSVRAGTVVRPSGDVDFDLDVLCWMEFIHPDYSPSRVWQLIWDALGEHKTYKEMRKAKARCVGLDFAAGYHLDITPAVADPTRPSPVMLVPDRLKIIWSPTNPVGFCDDWFLEIAKTLPSALVCFSAKEAMKNEGVVANRDTRVDPLPDKSGFVKAPLQRIVQMVKFSRDQTYSSADKHRPSSILLTTITALAYKDLVFGNRTSLTDFILEVIESLPDYVSHEERAGKYVFQVMNPVDDRENFAEKWTLETYQTFRKWAENLHSRLTELFSANPKGLHEGISIFEASIPGAKSLKLANDLGIEMRRQMDGGKLQLTAIPAVAASLTTIRPTTYFGRP